MAEDGDNNLEELRRHALLLENALNIVAENEFEEAALVEYVEAYKIYVVEFVARELSNALFADLGPLSARSSDAILVSYIALLRDCGKPDRIENKIDLFINSVALCNLGNAYFALGGNAALVCFVVEILVAVAARKVVIPEDQADQVVFDVLVDFIAKAEQQDENVTGAVYALRDFCAVSENRECAAMRGVVEALVGLIMRGLNDDGYGAAASREGALGALRHLLCHPAGRAAFAYDSQSGNAVKLCVGTFSAIVTDAAMCCLSTIMVYFPLCYSFKLLHPPNQEAQQRNFSRSARSMVVSVEEVMRTAAADHVPTEEYILSIFQQ